MADLVLGITANTDEASLRLRQLGQDVLEFAEKSVAAFVEQEKQDARLSSALKQLGYDAAALTPQFKAQAQAFQDTLGVSKDLVTQMQALMIRYGEAPRDIKATTAAILDYSAATGIDAERATMMLERAIDNGGKGLQRMGVHIAITGDKTKDLEAATKALGERWAGAAAAQAETLGGQIEQLHRQFDDLERSVGGFIATIEKKTGVLETLSSWAKDLTKTLNGQTKAAQELTLAQGGLVVLEDQLLKLEMARHDNASANYQADIQAKIDKTKELIATQQEAIDELKKLSMGSSGDIKTGASAAALAEEEAGQDALEAKRQAAADKDIARQQKLYEGFKKVAEQNIKLQEETDAMIVSEEKSLDAEHEKRLKKRLQDEIDNVTGLHRIHQDWENKDLATQAEHAKKAAQYQKQIDDQRLAEEKKTMDALAALGDRAMGEMVDALITGAEQGVGAMFKQLSGFLKSTAIQAVITAAKETAEAISALAEPATAALAAGHFTAAAEWGGVAALAGGGAIGFDALASSSTPEKHHDGGWAGEGQRYHDGGWAEVPATLLRGERVLSHREVDNIGGPEAVDSAARGGRGPLFGVLNIQTFDAVGVRDLFTDAGGRGLSQGLRTGKGYMPRMFGRR